MIEKPSNLDPKTYYKKMIDSVKDVDLIVSLQKSKKETVALFKTFEGEREDFAYADGKWSIKQLAQHITDCERILCYRALCFARKETLTLQGFDEGLYVRNDYSKEKTLKDIIADYEIARDSTISLVSGFHSDILDHYGNANGIEATPRIVSWFIVAHNYHHNKVIADRYLE